MKIKDFSLFVAALIGSLAFTTAFADEATDILTAYEQVSKALVSDDLAAAQKAAKALTEKAKSDPTLAVAAGAIAKADSLDAARAQFKVVSSEAEKLADGKAGYSVLTCPMAKADWVQSSKTVANPYLGQGMPTCGHVKKSW